MPQGSHTVKEAEKRSRLTVALSVIATVSGEHRDSIQLWGSKFGSDLQTGTKFGQRSEVKRSGSLACWLAGVTGGDWVNSGMPAVRVEAIR